MNRWNSQKSVTRGDAERITTFHWRDGLELPEVSGSSIVRRKPAKRATASKAQYVTLSEITVDQDGDILPGKSEDLRLHVMSPRSGRKIRLKITAMYRAGIAKTFCTLTMVAPCSDRVAVRALGKLFKLWRDQWGKFNFLWVAERQENGRIHFHIVLDRAIDIKKENARWVRVQYNSGIVYYFEANKKRYAVDPTNMSNERIAKYLNPLDIVYIRSLDNLAAYLATYVTKKQGEKYGCQVWNCSKGVSQLFTDRFIGTHVHTEAIKQMPGSPNIFIFAKDVVSKNGKIKHKAGDIILPVDHCNDHAAWVYICNRNFAEQYLKDLDSLNIHVIKGQVSASDIVMMTYFDYCKNYQEVNNCSYDYYKKIVHSKKERDCKSLQDLISRSIDIEQDFYQVGKAAKNNNMLAIYSEPGKRDRQGNLYYGGHYMNEHRIKLLPTIKNNNYADEFRFSEQFN